MLLERLTYADDLPMNITVANITEDPLHYHLTLRSPMCCAAPSS